MRRTTISIPDEMARALEREARRRGTSVSAVTREAIAERLNLNRGTDRELPFAALGRSGHSDTARRADDILAQEWDADRGR